MTDDERANMPNSDERPDTSTGSAADAPAQASAAQGRASETASQDEPEPAGATPDATTPDEHAHAVPDEPVARAEAAAPDAPADALAGEVAALKEQVAQLVRDLESERDHATNYMQQWQRAQADLSNFRRRVQQEEEQFANMAAAQAIALVLPALDSFERAFKTLPESLQRLTWIEGIFLVESQLRHTLEAHGVTPFEPRPGDTLDAARHQPVAQTETTVQPEGTVVEAVQRGYELHGRVLRPALVRVARAPSGPPPGERDGGSATSGNGPPPSTAEEGGAGP